MTVTAPDNPLFSDWCAAVRKEGITSLFLVHRPDLRNWTAFVTYKDGRSVSLMGNTEEAAMLGVVGWVR
jgi:hypothetical protein